MTGRSRPYCVSKLGYGGRVSGRVPPEVRRDRVPGQEIDGDEDEDGGGEKSDDSDCQSRRDYPEHRLSSRRTDPLVFVA